MTILTVAAPALPLHRFRLQLDRGFAERHRFFRPIPDTCEASVQQRCARRKNWHGRGFLRTALPAKPDREQFVPFDRRWILDFPDRRADRCRRVLPANWWSRMRAQALRKPSLRRVAIQNLRSATGARAQAHPDIAPVSLRRLSGRGRRLEGRTAA